MVTSRSKPGLGLDPLVGASYASRSPDATNMAGVAQMLRARDMANMERSVFSPNTSVAMTSVCRCSARMSFLGTRLTGLDRAETVALRYTLDGRPGKPAGVFQMLEILLGLLGGEGGSAFVRRPGDQTWSYSTPEMKLLSSGAPNFAGSEAQDITRFSRSPRQIEALETDLHVPALTGAGCREFDTIAVWAAL